MIDHKVIRDSISDEEASRERESVRREVHQLADQLKLL